MKTFTQTLIIPFSENSIYSKKAQDLLPWRNELHAGMLLLLRAQDLGNQTALGKLTFGFHICRINTSTVLVSWVAIPITTTAWFKTTDIDSLTFLEATSLKSMC